MKKSDRSLRVALVQALPVLGAPDANLASIERALAAHPNADLMVWPELFLCGYTTRDIETYAEPLDGAAAARLGELARVFDTAIVVGFAEARDGAFANSALAIDRDGRVAGCYRKLALFGDESSVFTPGSRPTIATLCGQRVGLMICFDIEFPEIARAPALAGADLFVSISANMAPFAADHRLCVATRALENRCAHVYVNQLGKNGAFDFTGESAAADANGVIQLDCGNRREGVFTVELSLDADMETRPDYLALRPIALSPVVDDHAFDRS